MPKKIDSNKQERGAEKNVPTKNQERSSTNLRQQKIEELSRDLEALGQNTEGMTEEEKMEARKNTIDLSREKRSLELDMELENFSDFEKSFGEARKRGDQWKIREDILKDPEKQKRYAEYRKKLAEKGLLEVMPELEKEIPNLNYYITKNIEKLAVGAGLENNTQLLIAVEEGLPEEDPDKKTRATIIKKLIALGLTNGIALGEKFSGHDDKYQVYFDFIFFHKDKAGVYKSIRPDSKYVPEKDRNAIIGKKLPDKLNDKNTFQEIAPEDFEERISFPEYFRDDVVYNGIYLKGSDFKKKLDTYTLSGELSEEQKKLVERGYFQEDDFFSPEEANNIKQARLEQYRAANSFGKKYFRKDVLDKQSLEEIAKEADEVNFDKILANKTGAEIEKNIEGLELNPDLIPEIEGVSKDETKNIFKDLVRQFLFGHGNGGFILKNELISYPNQPQSKIAIMVLANSPKIFEAKKQIEELLNKSGQRYDEKDLHDKIVEFMKEVIASFKGVNKDEYWKNKDGYELIREKNK